MELMMKTKDWAVLLVPVYLTACHAAPPKPKITHAEPPAYHLWSGDYWAHSFGEGLAAENHADVGSDGAYFPSGQQLTLREKLVRNLSAEEPLYYAPPQNGQNYPLDGIRMQAMHPDIPSPHGARPQQRPTGHPPQR